MRPAQLELEEITSRIGAIPDPEIPVLTIADLGVLRSVHMQNERIAVTITPTYSGCPAMHHIEQAIGEVISDSGHDGEVVTVFSPAWTTDWMTEAGRNKLRRYGIAPPRHIETEVAIRSEAVRCPLCASFNTEVINRFGSTACKSLHRCLDCLEPFDHFKEF